MSSAQVFPSRHAAWASVTAMLHIGVQSGAACAAGAPQLWAFAMQRVLHSSGVTVGGPASTGGASAFAAPDPLEHATTSGSRHRTTRMTATLSISTGSAPALCPA